jgi:hypothetical protein
MTLPGFGASNALRNNAAYRAVLQPLDYSNCVIPQDCSIWKGFACAWVIGHCGVASFGGRDAYINCVDKLSRGYCVECVTGGVDPHGNPGVGTTSVVCGWE